MPSTTLIPNIEQWERAEILHVRWADILSIISMSLWVKPRLVVSHSTCPPLSSSPHSHNFVSGTVVINIIIEPNSYTPNVHRQCLAFTQARTGDRSSQAGCDVPGPTPANFFVDNYLLCAAQRDARGRQGPEDVIANRSSARGRCFLSCRV